LDNSILKNFKRLALASTLTTYFLIFVGGLVRVSGAGLGCPDWPKCFGRWIPPLTRNQIPAGFNPDTFNFTLAWIEYVNRLVGMIVGLLILATAIMAIIYFRRYKQILWPSVIAAVLVAFQGWYGSVVVASQLHPETVTIHMILALMIVSLLVYTTQTLAYLETTARPGGFPLRKWMISLWIITIIQVVLGTRLRAAIENLLAQFPLLLENQLLPLLGGTNYFHSFVGVLLAGITLLITMKIFAMDALDNMTVRFIGTLGLLLILLQIVIGSGMEIFGVLQIFQVFHLWIASLFVGILLMLYVELKNIKGGSDASKK
jgi:cytochrome c oxidase assembly protein subunit 15